MGLWPHPSLLPSSSFLISSPLLCMGQAEDEGSQSVPVCSILLLTLALLQGKHSHHSTLWKHYVPPTGDGTLWTLPISVGVFCRSWFSQQQATPDSVPLRVTAFLRINCLVQCGLQHRLQTDLFSADDLYRLQGLSLPSHHGWREMAAPSFSLTSSSLTWVTIWFSPPQISLPPSYSLQNKAELPKERILSNKFPLLNIFICRGADLLALTRGRVEFEPGQLFVKLLTEATVGAPCPAVKIPPDTNPTQSCHSTKSCYLNCRPSALWQLVTNLIILWNLILQW